MNRVLLLAVMLTVSVHLMACHRPSQGGCECRGTDHVRITVVEKKIIEIGSYCWVSTDRGDYIITGTGRIERFGMLKVGKTYYVEVRSEFIDSTPHIIHVVGEVK